MLLLGRKEAATNTWSLKYEALRKMGEKIILDTPDSEASLRCGRSSRREGNEKIEKVYLITLEIFL